MLPRVKKKRQLNQLVRYKNEVFVVSALRYKNEVVFVVIVCKTSFCKAKRTRVTKTKFLLFADEHQLRFAKRSEHALQKRSFCNNFVLQSFALGYVTKTMFL